MRKKCGDGWVVMLSTKRLVSSLHVHGTGAGKPCSEALSATEIISTTKMQRGNPGLREE